MSYAIGQRRALVTGASGFIGSHLVSHLDAAGWRVAVLLRPTTSHTFTHPSVEQIYFYSGSMDDLVEAVATWQPDVVFHLASLFLATHTSEEVGQLIAANVLFGAQLLEAMHLTNVRAMVNTGTAWQNGAGIEYEPVNLYAATKQAFEDILRYYVSIGAINAVTLRLYDSYGPGDTRRKLLRLMIDCARTNEPLGMSPGNQILDLAHVDDICRAFLCAADLASSGSGFRVYAVSGGERRTLRDVANTLEQAVGRSLPFEFGKRPYRDREVMKPWDGPLLPGWKPVISLLDGLRRLLVSET